MRDNQTEAETAVANLQASESSWRVQKQALDKELIDLNSRCQELIAQNGVLHQHLETVSTQAARIRTAVETSADAPPPSDEPHAVDTDGALAELRSVVAYVRREKEIAELQLDLNRQENMRLRAHSEHLAHTLEEARAQLSQVHTRLRFAPRITDILNLRSESVPPNQRRQPCSMQSFWTK